MLSTDTVTSQSHDVRIDDVRVRTVREITPPAELVAQVPTSPDVARFVCDTRVTIGQILGGSDSRWLVVVGPCSIHDIGGAFEYARRIRELGERYQHRLVIVMRVYFEKPRTRDGWKGLINDPYLDRTFQINDGLRLARQLLADINMLGVPAATEFVDPFTPQFLGDLISWAAIGARTTESQVHRELASGLSCPVGFKNSTSGDVRVAVNAVATASRPHHFLGITKSGRAAAVATSGNPDCHIILRGGLRPNYDQTSIAEAVRLLEAEGVCSRVMIDCSHGNAGGDHRRQLVVAEEIARHRRARAHEICGVMVESNLVAGKQEFVEGRPLAPGLSITDPCLGIDETAQLFDSLVRTDRG